MFETGINVWSGAVSRLEYFTFFRSTNEGELCPSIELQRRAPLCNPSPSLQAIVSEDEAGRTVSLTIPLHITVRLSSAAAEIEHEAASASEPKQTTSIINVQNPRSALDGRATDVS